MVPVHRATGGWNRLFDVLSHPTRRRVLTALHEESGGTRGPLAPVDVARQGEDVVALSERLRHVHLPKLADAEYVAWDRDAVTISRGPRFDEVARVIELLSDHDGGLPEDWA